tara:strand:- start:4737 stop:5195 length:459 start_codon:yes stop_codon:yes gene_type:complete
MDGGKFQQLVGSRRQVFNGTAKKTNYGKNGLEKKDLKMNKHGLIVSVKKSKTAKKAKHLGKFLQKRGSKTFGPRKTAKKSKGGQYAGDHCEGKKAELEEAQKAVDECEEEHKAKEDEAKEGEAVVPEEKTEEEEEEGGMDMNAGKKKKSKKH